MYMYNSVVYMIMYLTKSNTCSEPKWLHDIVEYTFSINKKQYTSDINNHYYNDYDRDVTRVYIFKALVKSLLTIRDNEITDYTVDQYLSIPENGKQFVDIGVYNIDYS